ncbi:hypothetical protein [Streptomyces sp. H27-C3]|uniref:hypothetical protein n=1 Tax=Streptomyces sp. H27-C3 TaxID=3046305 RepID=UPI0024BA6E9C|nr:hypothetical protein [Streptomyces sp. H27-C3]MDJ0460588.1 hypothetical protein [Streptomyces sp. H27-C3]
MPKITRHGGPTIAGASVVGGTWTDGDGADPWPAQSSENEAPEPPANREPTNRYVGEHGPEVVDLPDGDTVHPTAEGSDQSSAGSSSETSSDKPQTSPETSKPKPPLPVRTTGSRSGKARTGSPSARSTDGDQGTGTSEGDSASDGGGAE